MRSDRHGGEFSSRVDRSLRLRAQCQRAEPESTSRAYRRGVLRVGLRRHHQEDGPERRASLGFGLLDLGETQHGRDGSRSLRPSFLYHAVVFARKHPACPGSRDLESATHLGGVKTRTHRRGRGGLDRSYAASRRLGLSMESTRNEPIPSPPAPSLGSDLCPVPRGKSAFTDCVRVGATEQSSVRSA